MVVDAILIKYPSFVPVVLLSLGTLYFNYVVIRNYSHLHWNIFMVSFGFLAIGFLLRLLNLFYGQHIIETTIAGIFALSAVLFTLTAFAATRSDERRRT